MKDFLELVVITVFLTALITTLVNLGGSIENDRLYSNCLIEQQVHIEAVNICKERVK